MRYRIFIAFFAFVFFYLDMDGQREFKGGILAGAVTTQVSGDGLAGWDKFGFTAGAWVEVPFSEKSGMMMALKYINKGSRTTLDTINFNTWAYHLNYIDIPLLYAHHKEFRRANLMFTLGPCVGVLLNQKVIANYQEYEVQDPKFEWYDVGIQGGVAVWLSEKFYMDFSATTSVIPTRPAPLVVNKGSFYEKGNYNQTLQFTLGYAF